MRSSTTSQYLHVDKAMGMGMGHELFVHEYGHGSWAWFVCMGLGVSMCVIGSTTSYYAVARADSVACIRSSACAPSSAL